MSNLHFLYNVLSKIDFITENLPDQALFVNSSCIKKYLFYLYLRMYVICV
jgi:hypothetical protein